MTDTRPSFETLWQRLAPRVRAAAFKFRSKDAALDADDLAQEVRIRLWQVWQSDRKSRFATSYYYRVINSAMIDALRRHRGTLPGSERAADADQGQPEQLNSPEPGPLQQMDHERRQKRLAAALNTLPTERRKAVQLFLQGFTVPEIATLLACDENRAHNLTYRGIRSLKEKMGQDQD